MSLKRSEAYDIPVFRSICAALTLGGTGLGFDAILLIADFGQPTPEFTDKHLSYQWLDARWMYDTARALDVPLCASFPCPSLGAGLTPEHTHGENGFWAILCPSGNDGLGTRPLRSVAS